MEGAMSERDTSPEVNENENFPTITVTTVVSHYSAHGDCGVDGCRWFTGCNRNSEEDARGSVTASLYAHYRDEHGIDHLEAK
jgi:uncharacterized protein YodC (DUF2158 family)